MKYVLLLILAVCCSVVSQGQDKQQLKEEIDKVIYFDTDISKGKIPGYVIGIIVGDSVYVYGYGQKIKTDPTPPDEHTLFEIGSVTKVFTASLAGILSDEGIINHDSSLNLYLPLAYRNPKLSNITIAKLLTHTSGLPKMPTSFGLYEKEIENPYAHYTKESLLQFYKDFEPEAATSSKNKRNKGNVNYLYSHLNYAILEVALETVTGKTFPKLLEEKIFSKIEMPFSFIDFQYQEQADKMAAGYGRSGKQVNPWEFSSFSASQGMKSSAVDLLQFLKIHINNPTDTLGLSLYNNTIPAVETGLTENASMGYGWHILHQKKFHNIVLHAGSTGGHRAFIGFIRETKTGVVVLSNSENGTGGLGYLLLRLINFNWKKK